MTTENPAVTFRSLGLGDVLVKMLDNVGYETPSPIQAASIPELLAGRDLIGQAQTGTGKTAAFALPILQKIDPACKTPQALVLAPTRELAIQVAEAFQSYSVGMKGFNVLPVYGGADMSNQLRALRKGVQVIVGTPGRLLDHLRRQTMDLSALHTIVLDEADEMLRMGFIDDVETILASTPDNRQTALFSATMPPRIRDIAERYLRDPVRISIASKTATVSSIDQFYLTVNAHDKLEILTQVLEAEEIEGMIIFVRTRETTTMLAEKLTARGIRCSAINGDINQAQREKTIQQLRKGAIDVLVATDVAARGLDVERITHVVNYDIPYDSEAYVHRIGRTGRAGRKGRALLLVTPREQRLLHTIERATRQPIERYRLPSSEELAAQRQARVIQQVSEALASDMPMICGDMIDRMGNELAREPRDIAAALLRLLVAPETLVASKIPGNQERHQERVRDDRPARQDRPRTERAGADTYQDKPPRTERPRRDRGDGPEAGMQTYRIEVGREAGITPSDIVGAIANEANMSSKLIGRIKLEDNFSTVDLPSDLSDAVFQHLKTVRVRNIQLQITRSDNAAPAAAPRSERNAPSTGKPRSDEKRSERKPFRERKENERAGSGGERKTFRDKPVRDKPAYAKPAFDKPAFEKKVRDKPVDDSKPAKRSGSGFGAKTDALFDSKPRTEKLDYTTTTKPVFAKVKTAASDKPPRKREGTSFAGKKSNASNSAKPRPGGKKKF